VDVIEPNPTEGYYRVRTQVGEEGWLWGRNLTFGQFVGPAVASLTGMYAIKNASCPPVGKHKKNGVLTKYSTTSDGGMRNMAKRHIPAAGTPVTLEMSDFERLQTSTNTKFGNAATTKKHFSGDRSDLHGIATLSGTASEGDLVQLAAYIIEVRPQGPESVNCAGQDGTDSHISVGGPKTTEWRSVVVEMIPQFSPGHGWNAATLRRLRTKKMQVLVVGGLTYDNEHYVNKESSNPKHAQPKRMSLWEIHPITQFYVCRASTCDPQNLSEWMTLAAWAKANPK